MERIDRRAMTEALYPALLRAKDSGRSASGLARVIAASTEGYPFPADLDHDQPVDGMAPASMADIVADALSQSQSGDQLRARLDKRFGPQLP
ncbi:MAG: hypothetical protein GY724_09305 [Actinomycetia bacterium]|nr:hypothetical protein [Actinomycetes bacterium]